MTILSFLTCKRTNPLGGFATHITVSLSVGVAFVTSLWRGPTVRDSSLRNFYKSNRISFCILIYFCSNLKLWALALWNGRLDRLRNMAGHLLSKKAFLGTSSYRGSSKTFHNRKKYTKKELFQSSLLIISLRIHPALPPREAIKGSWLQGCSCS